MREELERIVVCPLEILDDDDDRLARCGVDNRLDDGLELCPFVGLRREFVTRELAIDGAERHVRDLKMLEALADGDAALRGIANQLRDEPALADAGIAHDKHSRAAALGRGFVAFAQVGEFLTPARKTLKDDRSYHGRLNPAWISPLLGTRRKLRS